MNIRAISKVLVVGAVCVAPFMAIAEDGGPSDASRIGTHSLRYDNFKDIDTNHDGVIVKREANRAKLDGILFKEMDTNRDGQISEEEFEAYKNRAQIDN